MIKRRRGRRQRRENNKIIVIRWIRLFENLKNKRKIFRGVLMQSGGYKNDVIKSMADLFCYFCKAVRVMLIKTIEQFKDTDLFEFSLKCFYIIYIELFGILHLYNTLYFSLHMKIDNCDGFIHFQIAGFIVCKFSHVFTELKLIRQYKKQMQGDVFLILWLDDYSHSMIV